MTTIPTVSVICSVFNSQKFITQSVKSILKQSFKDYEFIIFNDGSTDDTGKILDNLEKSDQRIIVVHQKNKGLTPTLNAAISMARGRLVARQDDDDLSLPNRLKTQVEYLKQHPTCAVVGSRYKSIDEENNITGKSNVPLSAPSIRRALLTHNVIAHSSAMFQKQMVLDAGGYDERYKTTQDYALWCKLASHHDVANLKNHLLLRRLHTSQIGKTKSKQQLFNRNQVRQEYRRYILEKDLSIPGLGHLKFLSRLYNLKDMLLDS